MNSEKGNRERKLKKKGQQDIAKRRNPLGSFFISYGLIVVTAVLFILFSLVEPMFFTTANIFTITRQASIFGILALGLTLIVVVGEFDISFVAVSTFAAIISVILIMQGIQNSLIVWTIGLAFAIVISLANSALVVYTGIPSFVATLGMMLVLTGISRGFTGGITTYPAVFPPGFDLMGRHMAIGLIPTPTIIFAAVAVLVVLLTDYTPTGRYIYSVGGNPQAAVHVGINLRKTKILVFFLAGVLYGITGIVMSSWFGSASVGMGEGYLLPSIIACFLGAAFLTEGLPNPRGTVVSAVLLAVLTNGLIMIRVPFYTRSIIQGIVLLVSIGLLVYLRRKRLAD